MSFFIGDDANETDPQMVLFGDSNIGTQAAAGTAPATGASHGRPLGAALADDAVKAEGDEESEDSASEEDEDDLLDRAWGLTPVSRLSCQAIVGSEDLVVEIPKYTINYAKEATK